MGQLLEGVPKEGFIGELQNLLPLLLTVRSVSPRSPGLHAPLARSPPYSLGLVSVFLGPVALPHGHKLTVRVPVHHPRTQSLESESSQLRLATLGTLYNVIFDAPSVLEAHVKSLLQLFFKSATDEVPFGWSGMND